MGSREKQLLACSRIEEGMLRFLKYAKYYAKWLPYVMYNGIENIMPTSMPYGSDLAQMMASHVACRVGKEEGMSKCVPCGKVCFPREGKRKIAFTVPDFKFLLK